MLGSTIIQEIRCRPRHADIVVGLLFIVLLVIVCARSTPPTEYGPSPPPSTKLDAATSDAPPLEIQLTDQLQFQHLTTQDGLSEGRVWDIIQDRHGILWFTTWDGLNRYDGYEFKVYKEGLGNRNSPGGIGFWVVKEYQDGMIWAGFHPGGGLSRFNPLTEQWQRYQHDPNDLHSLSSNTVCDIYEDGMGVLWVATGVGGLNVFMGRVMRPIGVLLAVPMTLIAKEVVLEAYPETRKISNLMSVYDPYNIPDI